MSLSDNHKSFFQCLESETEFDAPLSLYTSFKTGGNADVVVNIKSCEELKKTVIFCKENNIKTLIIGNGSNLLIRDKGFDGAVIHLGRDFDDIKLTEDGVVECLAGTSLVKLCRFALENSLTGLEFAYGIPGTVGGGAYMNAGAYGGELKDVMSRCDHMDKEGNTGSFEKDELKLSYRSSAYKDSELIITKAYFKLEKGDKDKIKEAMDDVMQRRKDKQPLEYPSAGSTFKRPEGYFAGKLIEDCGLKGVSVGGAMVSEKHSGFIINYDNATSSDILRLIGLVQDTVLANTGVFLETEVKII